MGKLCILLCLLGLLWGLSGCEVPWGPAETLPGETVHVHRIAQGQVVRPLSCTTDEWTLGICRCGQVLQQVTARTPGRHSFRGGVCTACSGVLGTELEFALNPDGKSYSVVGMGACRASFLVIPDSHQGKPVTAIGPAAFFGQKELLSVEVPEGIVSIGQAAFSDTLVLHTVLLPESLKTIETLAFSECRSLRRLYLPAGVESLGENTLLSHGVMDGIYVAPENPRFCSVDGVLYSKDMTRLLCYPSGKKAERFTVPEGVREIAAHAFQRTERLETVILPESLEVIGSSGFYLCRNLKEIRIPGSVKTVGDLAFSYCEALKAADLPEGVTSVGMAAFSGCFSLEAAVVPDSVTRLGSHVFSNCPKLKRLTIGTGVTALPDNMCTMSTTLEVLTVANVNQIGKNALMECFSLLEIRFAGTVEEWENAEKVPGWDRSVGKYTVQCRDGTITCTPE